MPFVYDTVLQERIWLTNLENQLITSTRFQKLKKIKQNGFSYLMYPDARNTRFDHSIGTMYWVTKLYSSINDYEGKSIEDNKELLALRIAALIHDVGHGPFSHCLEELLYRNDDLLAKEPWNELIKTYEFRPPHELMTLNYINSNVFKNIINEKNLYEKILDIINKKINLSLLISGDLDADRLDYLTRDSHYSGLPFGFNIKVIFNEILDKNLTLYEKGGKSYLMLDRKALPAFEQLLLARYCHYKYIAYEPRIQSGNLFFISTLEDFLRKHLINDDRISEFIYEIFRVMHDEELLDLNFYNISNDKFLEEIKKMNKDEDYRLIFRYLNNNIEHIHKKYLRIINLGKNAAYNIMKKGNVVQLRQVEAILKCEFDKDIKLSVCMPSALAMNTCIADEDLDPKYAPSYVYDYSPLIQGLEQKMYQDIGLTIISNDEIDLSKIISKINDLTRNTVDFDYYAFGIITYIEKVPELFEKNQRKWELKRARIYNFIEFLYEKLIAIGKIDKKLNFDIPYYNKDVYDIIQKLEFLDVINEDYNIKHGKGSFIPSYIYSLGEYSDNIKSTINLTKAEKDEITDIVYEYFNTFRSLWM